MKTSKPQTLQEKYGFHKNAFLSIDQALNIAHKENNRTEADRRTEAEKIEYEPSFAPEEDKLKFLEYCLSLCKGHKEFVAILRLKMYMSTSAEFSRLTPFGKNCEIAKQLSKLLKMNIKPEQVEKMEKEAIKFVQDQISATKATCLPLVGGM